MSVHCDCVVLQETAKDDDVYEMPARELCKDLDDENAFTNQHFPAFRTDIVMSCYVQDAKKNKSRSYLCLFVLSQHYKTVGGVVMSYLHIVMYVYIYS